MATNSNTLCNVISSYEAIQGIINQFSDQSQTYSNLTKSNLSQENIYYFNKNHLLPIKVHKTSRDDCYDVSIAIDKWITSRENILSLNLKKYHHNLRHLTSGITDQHFKGNQKILSQELNHHLQKISEYKHFLAWYLQQPMPSNFFSLHYYYHKEFEHLLEMVIHQLSNCNQFKPSFGVKNLSPSGKMEIGISELTALLNEMREIMKDICNLKIQTKAVALNDLNVVNNIID